MSGDDGLRQLRVERSRHREREVGGGGELAEKGVGVLEWDDRRRGPEEEEGSIGDMPVVVSMRQLASPSHIREGLAALRDAGGLPHAPVAAHSPLLAHQLRLRPGQLMRRRLDGVLPRSECGVLVGLVPHVLGLGEAEPPRLQLVDTPVVDGFGDEC